jgi:hypothetical protein
VPAETKPHLRGDYLKGFGAQLNRRFFPNSAIFCSFCAGFSGY